jgi:hypothetical protein
LCPQPQPVEFSWLSRLTVRKLASSSCPMESAESLAD